MILRTLAVEGWRCFANRVEVGPLGDGLNVLHGPNGSGKSTLMGVLIRGLFDNHAGTSQAIKSLRPWGRDLSPTVNIVFEHGGETYSLTKRFLHSPCSELARQESGRMVRLAEGQEANQRLREMLAGEAPSRGETGLQHWGFAQVLWAPQKGIALEQLSPGMTGAIQRALGSTLSGGGAIEQRVADRFHAIYTPGGRLLGGANAPPLVALEARLKEANQRRDTLVAQVQQYEEASRRAEDFRNRRDQAVRDGQQRERDLETARRRAQHYREMQAACDKHRADAAAAEAQHSELQRRIDGIQATRQELAEAEKDLARADEDLPTLRRQTESYSLQTENARANLDRIRARRPDVDAAEERANRAARFVEQHRRLAETEDLLQRIDAAERREAETRAQRLAVCAPSAEALRAIRAAFGARDQAQTQLDAALITVRIVAEQPLDLEVLSAEQVGNQPVAPGQLHQIQGSPEVAFRVPGVGTFRATGPGGSVDELRKRIAAATRKIEELTKEFGSSDLEALQSLHARAVALDAAWGEAKAALAALLGGKTPDDMRKQRSAIVAVVEGLLGQEPAWAETVPDADGLRAEAARVRSLFVRDVEQAEVVLGQAQTAFNLASKNQAIHEANVRQLQQRVASIRQRLDTLTADGKDDAQREAELRRLAMGWQAAQAHFEQKNRDLRELGGDPAREVQILEEQVRHLQKSVLDLEAQFHNEQGRLQTLANEAPYSALAEVEESIQELQAGAARESLKYDAIRLLHQRIQEHRKSINQEVLRPVTQRATGTLERIAGSRLGAVQFGADFLPTAVTPAAAAEEITIDELCGGEQEQVYFAVRLALADVLFKNERQLVVLDDALTFTDSGRLARVLGILEEAAARFQILVLTCHPEKYVGLANASFFDLQQLLTRS